MSVNRAHCIGDSCLLHLPYSLGELTMSMSHAVQFHNDDTES
jgi:hypothetical protein